MSRPWTEWRKALRENPTWKEYRFPTMDQRVGYKFKGASPVTGKWHGNWVVVAAWFEMEAPPQDVLETLIDQLVTGIYQEAFLVPVYLDRTVYIIGRI